MFLGFILTVVVGLSWAVEGLWFKLAAKWNVEQLDVSFWTSLFSAVLMLPTIQYGALAGGEAESPGWGYVLFVIVAGGLNCIGCIVLQRSMCGGRSGMCWTIGQSALVVPFIVITALYHEPWSILKIGGTVAVLTGMATMVARSDAKEENAPGSGGFRCILLALAAFAILGTAQSMSTALSHFEYADPGNLRPVLTAAGSLLGCASGKAALGQFHMRINRKAILLIVLSAAQNSLGVVLQFVAMDKLSVFGMSGIFYPAACGLCIGGYAVISVAGFREKATLPFLAGTTLILGGIAAYAVAAV